jgi:hypothetical protein
MNNLILVSAFLMLFGCSEKVSGSPPATNTEQNVSSKPKVKGVVWLESFDGLKEGSMKDKGSTAWSTTIDKGDAAYAVFLGVQDGAFHAAVTASELVWKSQEIDISKAGPVSVSVDVEGDGGLDSDPDAHDFDYFRISCVIDGGDEKKLGELLGEIDDGMATLKSDAVKGKKLIIIIRALNTGGEEDYGWDNVKVKTVKTVKTVK